MWLNLTFIGIVYVLMYYRQTESQVIIVYNDEKDDQIFIRLSPDQKPIEFLLDQQPLEMIRAGIVTKDEIRETVEKGRQDVVEAYSRAFPMQEYSIMMNVFVHIDEYLRIVSKIEKTYF